MNKNSKFRMIILAFIFLGFLVATNPAKPIFATQATESELLIIKENISTSFNRSYEWDIDKSVSPDTWDMLAGESGDSAYTVSVSRSQVDSGWTITGLIAFRNVSNHPVTITSVEDLITPSGVSAVVTCDFTLPITLPAGWAEDCSFTASLPDGSAQTSTAMVHTSGGAIYTASIDFDFSEATINETGFSEVNVVDTQGEAWIAGGNATWIYDRTFTCPTEETYYDNGLYSFQVDNTATITETGQSDDATVTVTCALPTIDIRKQVEGPDLRTFPSGSDVEFEIVVTNTGVVNLTNVEVIDIEVPSCSQYIGDLAAGESVTYTCTAPAVTENFTNIAVVTGQAGQIIVDDEDPSSVEVVNFDIRKQEEGPDSRTFPNGMDVPFEIEVRNVGLTDLTDVEVIDVEVPDCSRFIGDLAAGDSYTYTCTILTVTETFTNTAEATGRSGEVIVSDEDTSTVEIADIDIRKQAEGPDSRTFPNGSAVTFEIVVTNTGDVNLTDVEVTDELAPECARVIGDLGVGESFTYSCTVENVLQGFTNVAVVTGHSGDVVVSDEDPSTVELVYKIYLPAILNRPGPNVKFDVYMGYEDLPLEPSNLNDFDYNDWLVFIDTDMVGVAQDNDTINLEKIVFQFTPQARGATLNHEFHMEFLTNTFGSDGTATLIITGTNGVPISTLVTNFDSGQTNDFLIFDCTCEPIPPAGVMMNTTEGGAYTSTHMTATIMIEFDNIVPFNFNPDYGPHGEDLFFNPYIHVLNGNDHYNVPIGDVRTVAINKQSWDWPEERIRIDKAYPLVVWNDVAGHPEFPATPWWDLWNECVYGDGTVCQDPDPFGWLDDLYK